MRVRLLAWRCHSLPYAVWTIWLAGLVSLSGADTFVNFETAPIHPLALSSDGQTLAACNLPDARVELFDIANGGPVQRGNVPVGIDPVSLRFRTDNELWVVNHISSTISIVEVDKRRVVATLNTLPGPADIVFAGSPARAFVSCSRANTLQVFDPATRQCVTNIVLDGERPKSIARSPDGSRVYVAIFESGNASTILAPPFTPFGFAPTPGPVEDAAGPYQGQNPPPNQGAVFNPAINTNIYEAPPRVSQIVKKNAAGRWLDDNSHDWTEYVSGTNAHLSGRVEGWDIPDRDLAIVNATDYAVTYITGLMNICMDVAANPASGEIAVIGTDGTNERRFESNVRATFLRVNVALINPVSFGKSIRDLNPHLDYISRTLPQSERDKSIGDPRGIVWKSDGTRGYVTGMGSGNLVMIDTEGNRVHEEPIELGEGPCGMALDETRQRLYVLNRFSATISVLDTASSAVITNVPFFDPTPAEVRLGRRHFYDTRRNSGLGHTACASCHLDGRMDRLAWDLGEPSGPFLTITSYTAYYPHYPDARYYHPMKGPMVTQTLQDIIGHEPFHWRGDRESIEQFNPTFGDLLGRDTLLTEEEMQEFKAFLATMHFPPNPYRNLDDSLPEAVPLPSLYGAADPSKPLVSGDPVRGKSIFNNPNGSDNQCRSCHNPPTGLGDDGPFLRIPDGARHFELPLDERTLNLRFKTPQLRNLPEKLGLDYGRNTSRAGFGFTHDGRVDTLSQFLFRGFRDPIHIFGGNPEDEDYPAPIDRNIADMIAFLFCFSATDPVINRLPWDEVAESRDVATATGRQATITSSNEPLVATFLSLAHSASNRLDLIARGAKDGIPRGWYFAGAFLSDRAGETIAPDELFALASATNPLTLTLVPRGTGRRIGIDRDNDGWPDRTEIDAGFDPADPNSHGPNTPPRIMLHTNYIAEHAGATLTFTATGIDPEIPQQQMHFAVISGLPDSAAINSTNGIFRWPIPPGLASNQQVRMYVRVTDDAWPYLSDVQSITLHAAPFRMLPFEYHSGVVRVRWDAIPYRQYRLQYTTNLVNAVWTDWEYPTLTSDPVGIQWDLGRYTNQPQKFFRVRAE